MPALNSTHLAQVADVTLSLHEFLQALRRRSQLEALIRQVVVEKLLWETAQCEGLTVSDAELQQAADRFRYHHGLTSTEQTHERLADAGLSADDFEANLERDLLLAKLQRHVTEARVADHFAAHRERYGRARLRQIVVAAEGNARELLSQIRDEGRDFAELARTHSLHGPSRTAGGELGVVPRWALPPYIGNKVFNAQPGAVVGPVASADGWCLYCVDELCPATLEEETTAVIRRELFADWLNEQLRDLRIDLSCLESA